MCVYVCIIIMMYILNILQVFICKLNLSKAEKEKRNVLQKLCSTLKGHLLQWTDQLWSYSINTQNSSKKAGQDCLPNWMYVLQQKLSTKCFLQ